jgi:hypothetical protein
LGHEPGKLLGGSQHSSLDLADGLIATAYQFRQIELRQVEGFTAQLEP